MASQAGQSSRNNYLFVWPNPIPNTIRTLLTMAFTDTHQLIEYIREHRIEMDKFHLFIPLHGLEYLLQAKIEELSEVVRINVIYDNLAEKMRVRSRFPQPYEKIKCWTLTKLWELWTEYAHERSLTNTSLTNEQIKVAINQMMRTRLATNQLDIRCGRSQIVGQLPRITLHGFSAKNLSRFYSSYVCRCCKLICRTAYRLTCNHQHCAICVNIREK